MRVELGPGLLETVVAGVPVLTWPMVFEQFITERFVTEVLEIGDRLWPEGAGRGEEHQIRRARADPGRGSGTSGGQVHGARRGRGRREPWRASRRPAVGVLVVQAFWSATSAIAPRPGGAGCRLCERSGSGSGGEVK